MTNRDVTRYLAEKMTARRKELGWTVQVLADSAGIQRQHVSAIMEGNTNMSCLSVAKLLTALGLTLKVEVKHNLDIKTQDDTQDKTNQDQ